jgi:hypothetical protein
MEEMKTCTKRHIWFFLDVYTCSSCKIKGRVAKAQFASAIWSMGRFRYVGIDQVPDCSLRDISCSREMNLHLYIRRRSSPLLQTHDGADGEDIIPYSHIGCRPNVRTNHRSFGFHLSSFRHRHLQTTKSEAASQHLF